ncbi:unnamed protein product, partial [Laminaria digitata]
MTTDVIPAAPEVEIYGGARLAHDGWVSEFEAFKRSETQQASNNGGALHPVPASARSGRSAAARGAATTPSPAGGDSTKGMDNLRAEIKLLHWHKLANEAALKAALLKTKKIKAQGGGTTRPVPAMTTLSMPTEERAAWMQQVIEEEQSKPLQVTKDFMSKYEEKEKENEGRLDNEVAAHIRSLRNLRKQIEKRGEMKARRIKYRAAQHQLDVEKQQLLVGKLQGGGDGGRASSSTPGDPGGGGRRATNQSPEEQEQRARTTVGALDTVLGSLDKLVELEKRISSLEKSNVYDDFNATTKQRGALPAAEKPSHASHSTSTGRRRPSGPAGGGGGAFPRRRGVARPGAGEKTRRLSFSKQKSEATVDGPSQVYYSVRVRRKAGSISDAGTARRGRTGGVSGTSGATGQRVQAGAPSARDRGGGASTFLTQLPDVHRNATTVTAAAAAAGAGRSGGIGRFRSAISEKKRVEAKRKIAGDRAEALRIARQDRIIREWMHRKKVAAATGSRQRNSSLLSGSGRASVRARVPGGRTSSRVGGASVRGGANTHLQEFRDIRAHYAKRTEKLRRDLSNRRTGPEGRTVLAGTRTNAVARPRPAPPAAFAAPSRPVRMSRPKPGLERRRDVRRVAAAGVGVGRGKDNVAEERGGRLRRPRQGVGVAARGTGMRAAR